MNNFKKGDYVLAKYDGELLTSKILKIDGDQVDLEVCLSARRGENIILDQLTLPISDIQKLNVKIAE